MLTSRTIRRCDAYGGATTLRKTSTATRLRSGALLLVLFGCGSAEPRGSSDAVVLDDDVDAMATWMLGTDTVRRARDDQQYDPIAGDAAAAEQDLTPEDPR